MPYSQNGLSVNPPRSRRLVAGTEDVYVTVADGIVGDLLMLVAECWDKFVEDLELDSTRGELDDWGYAYREVRGGVEYSNHASASALDFNATRHVLGASNTFSPYQVSVIREILRECQGTIRWGGDYSGRKDEMHVEINTTSQTQMHAAYQRLRAWRDARLSPPPEQIEYTQGEDLILHEVNTEFYVVLSGGLTTQVDAARARAVNQFNGLPILDVTRVQMADFMRKSDALLEQTALLREILLAQTA